MVTLLRGQCIPNRETRGNEAVKHWVHFVHSCNLHPKAPGGIGEIGHDGKAE